MKLNKPLIKEVIRGLATGKVNLIEGQLSDGKNYCSVGYMTAVAARKMPEEARAVLENKHVLFTSGDSVSMRHTHVLCQMMISESTFCEALYGIPANEISYIEDINDSLPNSKARVKALGERLCRLLHEPDAEG